MSTQSQPDSGPTETTKLKLNAPRLIAGTLAAVTGAALSSRLGVTGTLVGTGVISLVSGTAATVYEHSVERGRAAVRNRLSALEDDGAFGRLRPVHAEAAGETGSLTATADSGKSGPGRLRTAVAGLLHSPGRRWAMAAAGALATFVVALGIVTVIEVAHGSSLSGTGHQTTLGQAFSGSGHSGPQHEHRQPTPAGSPASNSPAPSATPSPSPPSPSPPSQSPSSSPPSDTPSSTAPPSATPSQQSTQAPTTNPPTTNPPASGPSQAPTSAPVVPSPQPSE